MFSYCTNYSATMPDITVFMNCDTRLAINLRQFNLEDNDEFIFAIKNYSYIDSSYVFLFKARNSDMDENGEVIFRIPPSVSKRIKPGAFYNFSTVKNAFDLRRETEYKKLSSNGNIIIDYGAHDLLIVDEAIESESDIIGMRLERVDDDSPLYSNRFMNEVKDIQLESID